MQLRLTQRRCRPKVRFAAQVETTPCRPTRSGTRQPRFPVGVGMQLPQSSRVAWVNLDPPFNGWLEQLHQLPDQGFVLCDCEAERSDDEDDVLSRDRIDAARRTVDGDGEGR